MMKFVVYSSVCVAIFVTGYTWGAQEFASDAIRLGDFARFIIYFLALGIGICITGFFLYLYYIGPDRERLSIKEQEFEQATAALRREKETFEKERKERIENIVQNNEEILVEHCHQALKGSKMTQRRKIEEEVESKYRAEMERIRGINRPKEEEKNPRKWKAVKAKAQTYQASSGKVYARLREGEPL